MKKILILQTGGTIAMQISRDGNGKMRNDASGDSLQKFVPEISRIANIETRLLYFKDSSDTEPADWITIAGEIEKEYDNYDGFVVLHGTDTMAYTASAISFCFENLGKPVILTGSQVPLNEIRSDASRNLINAVQMATLPFNEVGICFNDRIFRGNRTTKMSVGDFNAFTSPNHPPLAEIGIDINIKYTITPKFGKFRANKIFSDELLVLRLYPGFRPKKIEKLVDNGVRAVILLGYGSGNFPIQGDYSIKPLLEKCHKNDIFIIAASQAPYDAINLDKYQSGRYARDLGALSAGDMTMEATITKMMHLLGKTDNKHHIREQFLKPIAGEITV